MDQNPSAPQSADHQPPPQNPEPPPVPTSSSSLPPPATTASFPNPNQAPTPRPPTTPQPQQSATATNPQTRPPFNTRPWQQQPQYSSHFSLPSPPLPDSTSPSAPPPPRGGMAIGVPAQMSTPPPPPTSLSSLTPPSYTPQSQIRQPMQGMGMTGTLGTSPSSMRPPSHQLRHPTPQSSPATQQNFQGHGMLRVSSLGSSGSPSSPSPSSLQSQSQTQPWLSSGTQGKPPLPSPPLRPQSITQSFQQRSHITPLHPHSITATSQQQSIGSAQQPPQPSASTDHYTPQFSGSRIQQSISHQQQVTRGPGLGSQRPTPGITQYMGPGKTSSADTEETSNRIVNKRSIQDLVNQIDPSEKLDPEVEDALVEIAEDFVEKITEYGCKLAKHRKSTTLEAKDIFVHLERKWHMTLPGFGGDEIKMYKKPIVSEIHKERLASVRKSILATEAMSKNPPGPSGGNAKSHLPKGPATGNIGAT